jgi:hypothetical protein
LGIKVGEEERRAPSPHCHGAALLVCDRNAARGEKLNGNVTKNQFKGIKFATVKQALYKITVKSIFKFKLRSL